MGMRYYAGKVLLIGSSSILLLEATVCIVRKLNICLLARKSNCVFCQREKRQIAKKSGYSNYMPILLTKNYHNITVLPGIIKATMSIFKVSSGSRQHPSNSSLYTEEMLNNDMRHKENVETEYIARQITKLDDNYNFSKPSSARLLYYHGPNIIAKQI